MLNFGAGADTKTQLQTLYKDLYSEGKYSDLWFLWDGKPLVLAGQNCISPQEDRKSTRLNSSHAT